MGNKSCRHAADHARTLVNTNRGDGFAKAKLPLTGLGFAVALIALLWTVIPLALGLRRFRRRDF
jgi:hypothetical protein